MNDVTKILIGKHLTGIIGLKNTLKDIADSCKKLSDDQVGKILIERLSKTNYIEKRMEDTYEKAFVREYKKYIGVPVKEEIGEGVDIKVLGGLFSM